MNYKNIITMLFFLFSLNFLNSDIITLKNNETFEGTIIKEENEFVLIKMSFGSARIEKNDILKIDKNSTVDSVEIKLDKMLKNAKNKEEFIEVADFAFENNLTEKGIIILQRAWMKDKSDSILQKRIDKEKAKEIELILNEASLQFKEGNFRLSAEILHKNFKKFNNFNSFQEEYWGIKRELYKILIDEKSTKESLFNIIEAIKHFSKTDNKKAVGKKVKSTSSFDILDFYQQEKKFSFEYSSIIAEINNILQIKTYIEKNQLNDFATKPLHSKQVIDASRANITKFNQLNAENNTIYQARLIARKYNQLLKQLNYNFNKINDKLIEEEKLWLEKGFQKVCGEWIKDADKIKKAQGYILFYGVWLDPSDEKLEVKKQEILQKLEDEKQEKEKQEIKPIIIDIDKDSNQKVEIDSTEKDIIERSQNISENIKNAFSSESKKNKLSDIIKIYIAKELNNIKENGIPIHLGIIILSILFFIIYIMRRK